MNIHVTSGDITHIASDAILCPISNDGYWFGQIHAQIRNCADNLFHQQIPQGRMRKHGDTYLATSDVETDHDGVFRHILFVVDEGASHTIRDLIFKGLCAASNANLTSISIPLLRSETSVTRGDTLATGEEIMQLIAGVMTFQHSLFKATHGAETWRNTPRNSKIESITFVAYDDPSAVIALTGAFAKAFA